MKWMVLGAALWLGGCVTTNSDDQEGISFDGFTTAELTSAEKALVIDKVKEVLGVAYLWGGQSVEDGFDCSGLIVWAYGKAKLLGFKFEDRLVEDVTAHSLYLYNSTDVSNYVSLSNLERGDWIFFDTDYNGTMEHMSVFSHVDDEDNVWVWDAYSVQGEVAFRQVQSFWAKNPYFAKPRKVIPEE